MSRNNIKILTDVQLAKLNSKYLFILDGDDIVVSNRNYSRDTRHPKNKSFAINSKIRKVTFSIDAINYWIECVTNDIVDYSLFDIQQAVNKLYVLYQPINFKSVMKILKTESTKIKEK